MIALVTDSTAYLTENEAVFYGVQVVPSLYTVGGRLFREKYADSPYDADIFAGQTSVTFQPSEVDFLSVFTNLASSGCSVICLTLSSKLSRAYSHALSASKLLPNADIRVINTTLTVGGQFTLVKRARLYINSGLKPSEIEARLNEDKKRIRIRFTVDELDTLMRSKRLSYVRRSISTALNDRPILECSGGALRVAGTARTGSDRIIQLTRSIPDTASSVTISYIDKTPCLRALLDYLRKSRPSLSFKLRKIGPVVGINIGRSIIAVSWME